MTQVISRQPLTAPFADFADARGGLPWIDALRRQGLADFCAAGLPTTRDEEWRQTNVAPIGKTNFVLPDGRARVSAAQLEPFAIAGLDAHELVFVDGRFADDLSRIGALPGGAIVMGLARALGPHRELVAAHLGRYAKTDGQAFTALNTAYLDDGAFIYVPGRVRIDKPIHLLFVSTDGTQALMTHPRVLVVVEAQGQVDVIEHHVGLGENSYFTNAVTEIVLDRKAGASHSFVERDSPGAYNVSMLAIHQQAETDFASHSVLLGGKLVRNNIEPTLVGEYCHSVLNGIYLPDGTRHMDNHMRVHHAAANCDSRQYYTGVLRDKASAVFVGRIVVDRGAQKTDAVQSSRGLLLGEEAYLHTRPQLEIFADDVKCTHGATIGELDEASLFYLESRGIPAEVARGMLIYSFAAEALARIQCPPLRDELARLLIRQLKLSNVEALVTAKTPSRAT